MILRPILLLPAAFVAIFAFNCLAAKTTLAVLFGGTGSDPTVGVLPSANDTYANWKNAGLGLVGGIPNRNTVCATISPSGKIPPQSGDDASVISAAESSCAVGDVLMLASGTWNVAQSEEPILINKSITIRGTGSPSNNCATGALTPCWPTQLVTYDGAIADWTISGFPAGANCGVTASSTSTCSAAGAMFLVSPSGNFNWGWAGCNLGTTPTGCGTPLDADAAQGQVTVQVHSTNNFSVGMWVLIDENPEVVTTTNPLAGQASIQASPDFLSTSPSPATMRLEGGDEPSSYSFNPNRVNAELHLVTAVGPGPCPGTSCTLTFDDPLTLAFRQSGSHNAQVYWPTVQGPGSNPFLQEAGIENMTIQRPGNGGIDFVFCAYCWVKNVEVGGWIAGAVNFEYSARDEITGNYFHDCFDCENNGAEYPVGISSASTEVLMDNNIVLRGGKGMVGRAANTAVVAYNYMDDTFYMNNVIGDYWVDMDDNGSHYGGTHHFLNEGNWAANCDGDETHGNAIYHVFFRVDCTGLRTDFTDPSNNKLVSDTNGIGYATNNAPQTPGPRRAAGPMAYNYWYGFVGNVLGKAGVTTIANGWTYKCTALSNECIWMSGWTAAEWNYTPDTNLNGTNTTQFIFRHGNYDYVNGAINDWAPGYSQNLPNSFYLSSAPAYFGPSGTHCTYPWPWVTPNATAQLQPAAGVGCTADSGLPAKARFDAGSPFVQP